MVTLDNLTKFSGEDGEDAFRWYRNFLDAVGPLGERGMLNHFPLYMEPDSLAQMWCDELPKEVLSSWTDVDRNFRRTWLCNGGAKVEAMERFLNHHLTEDAIFTSTSADVETMNKVIVEWAENHAKLGDAALVQATLPNLPVFIRAFLKYKSSPPKTFRELCTKIKEIEDHILEFEQLRRQEKGIEWQAKAERKQDDPKVVESNEVDDTLLFPPVESQSVEVLPNKAEMVAIVKEAIVALRKYKASDITIDAACMIDIGLLHYCNAGKVPSQFQKNTVIGTAGTKSTIWEGILEVNYQAFNRSVDASKVRKTWESFTNPTDMVKGECIYKKNYTRCVRAGEYTELTIGLSCNSHFGGLIQLGNGSKFPYLGLSSFGTALYFLLSVYLAELIPTDVKTYQQAAIDSAQWIQNWAYDEGTHLVKIFIRDIWSSRDWPTPSFSPHVTGLFIEGLCVLADVTGEQKWRSLTVDICNAAMVSREWHDNQGIFIYVSTSGTSSVDDLNIFRGLLFRGLSVAYQRNPDDSKLRNSIRSYINIQFNALRNCPHARGLYPVTWNTTSSEFYAHGQIAALDVLMAAVVVNHY